MTDRTYYEDAYLFQFRGNVVSTVQENGKFGVILDSTCFYPEGGGQPADHGWLNGTEVYDVRNSGANDVVHFVKQPLREGPVAGKIDARRRLDYMRQHTGQHIISQSFLQIGKYPTISVHFGEDYTTVEFDAEEIPENDLTKGETLANQIINRNLAVNTFWIDPEDVGKYNIRRPPPDVDRIRLVEIDGFDVSACGGTHVSRTGEIGLIKITGKEKLRGHTRLYAKIGDRAIADYDRKNRLVQHLMQTLTCGEDDIAPRIDDLQQQLRFAQREVGKLQADKMSAQARDAIAAAGKVAGITYVEQVFENADSKMMKVFVDEVISRTDHLAATVSRNGNDIRWIVAHSAGDKLNLRTMVLPLLHLMVGKGGGSFDMVQGGGKEAGGISEFLKQLRHKIAQELNS